MVRPANALEGGFTDPVLQAQSVFRAVMSAMAEPGTIRAVERGVRPPEPLQATAGAVACTLIDADTPIWLDPSFSASPAVVQWLSFHTGAPIVTEPSNCHFALISAPDSMPPLDRFALGLQEYPDRSATLIIQVSTLSDGGLLSLSGPGIRDHTSLAPAPLGPAFKKQWAGNNALFPRGVDIIFAAAESVAALPRTTRILERDH